MVQSGGVRYVTLNRPKVTLNHTTAQNLGNSVQQLGEIHRKFRSCVFVCVLWQALNALNLGMVRQMYPLYRRWAETETVKVIVQEGAGAKAFCAGGDVASLYHAHKDGQSGPGVSSDALTAAFFREVDSSIRAPSPLASIT